MISSCFSKPSARASFCRSPATIGCDAATVSGPPRPTRTSNRRRRKSARMFGFGDGCFPPLCEHHRSLTVVTCQLPAGPFGSHSLVLDRYSPPAPLATQTSMKNIIIILSLAGAAITGMAADNPLVGRGTLGVTNRAATGDPNPLVGRGTLGVTNLPNADSPVDPRIGRGTLGVVTNRFGTNLIPERTNGASRTNVWGTTNGWRRTTNTADGRILSPGNPVLSPPGVPPLSPPGRALSPPTNFTSPGTPVPPSKP
jgi:hypothetical protein